MQILDISQSSHKQQHLFALQSQAGKKRLGDRQRGGQRGTKLRIIFDGQDSQEPIISKLVLECQAPVNIIFADTRQFDGSIYGHMIIELPSDERQADKVIAWLRNSPVTWKEEA